MSTVVASTYRLDGDAYAEVNEDLMELDAYQPMAMGYANYGAPV